VVERSRPVIDCIQEEVQVMANRSMSPQHPGGGNPSSLFSRLTVRQWAIVPCAILIVVAGLTIPDLFSPDNIAQVLRQVSVSGIMAIGVTFVVIAGRLDLSIGSLLTLCALVTVTLHDTLSPVAAIAASLAIGLVVGCVNGVLVAYFRLNSLIATLGMLSLLQGVALLTTSGQNALIAHPGTTWFAAIGRGYAFGIPTPVIILAVLAVVMGLVLSFSNFGRRVFAVGGNETASAFTGVNTKATILAAYVISGLMTGAAAVVFSSRVMAAQNDSGAGYELSVLSGVILGGTSLLGGAGGIGRSIVGIVLLGFIQNALLLLGLPYYFQWIVTGAVIVGAVWADLASQRGRVFA
jgi:ribose transport system permease protein